MKKKILVIDVGGSHVKLMISRAQKRKFKSGPRLTPREMVAQIKEEVADWEFDAISMGFPSARAQRTDHRRTEASWQGLGRV